MLKKVIALFAAILPHPLNRLVYRLLLNAEIDATARIGFGTVILANSIRIGAHTVIGGFNRIKVTELSLGNYVSIGSNCKITVHRLNMAHRSIIGSRVDVIGDAILPESTIEFGMHSWVFDYCYVNVVRPVVMKRNVGVGGGTYIFTHGFWLSMLDGYPRVYAPVTLEDDVWLPWNCFVMPGVTVGRGAVVGARSLLTKDVPPLALAAGIPAKVIREKAARDVTLDEKIQMLTDMTSEYGKYYKKAIRWSDDEDGRRTFFSNDAAFLVLHKREPRADGLSSSALNVVPDDLPAVDLTRFPAYSLRTSRSSSYGVFGAEVRSWFQYGRSIGLRFYPVDELS